MERKKTLFINLTLVLLPWSKLKKFSLNKAVALNIIRPSFYFLVVGKIVHLVVGVKKIRGRIYFLAAIVMIICLVLFGILLTFKDGRHLKKDSEATQLTGNVLDDASVLQDSNPANDAVPTQGELEGTRPEENAGGESLEIITRASESQEGITVNGEEIQNEAIERLELQNPEMNRTDAVTVAVQSALLNQEAEKRSVRATSEEVDSYISAVKNISGLDDDALAGELEENGMTYDEYRQSVEDYITAYKLLDKELDLDNIKVSDKEIDIYINETEGLGDFFVDADEESRLLLREKIRKDLRQDKIDKAVAEYIEQLQAESTISAG